jgi:hypothetical protein
MDLKELNNIQSDRHPWETSRLNAIQRLLFPHIFEGIKVLDIGCGDGFISRNLFSHLQRKEVTAVDIHLSDERIQELSNLSCGIKYQREMPEAGMFNLILLLDVIEHVEDDHNFLANLVGRYISRKSKVLITVPAFQSLYGCHDVFLGHYRRYHLKTLIQLTTACGLCVLSSGYLFFTLLLPRLILYNLFNTDRTPEGVGNWRRGDGVTHLIETILNIDNKLLMTAVRFGIKFPGLTGWVLCEKR